MAEQSEKASIGGANLRCQSRAEQIGMDQNNGNKNRKRCDIIAAYNTPLAEESMLGLV
jgi:hypothetical protein